MELGGDLHDLAILPPGQELPTPTEQEVGWALDPVWMLQGRQKSLACARNQTSTIVEYPVCTLVTLLTYLNSHGYCIHIIIKHYCC